MEKLLSLKLDDAQLKYIVGGTDIIEDTAELLIIEETSEF